ncbi:amidohydrolase/deacetylase family metallohydrolase [Enterococcus sp. LJL99]
MLDLVIKKAHLLNGEIIDIGVKEGKIVQIQPVINASAKKTLLLKNGQYLSAGWIDDHVHCFEKMSLYYDYPDQIGVEKGVTTVIDAGTTGAENISDFYQLAKEAKTNVFALVNISKWGIVAQNELADLSKVQERLVKQVIDKFPEFIVGIKARMSKTVIGENDLKPLLLAKKIQKQNQAIPLMVHIGSAPPILDHILNEMDSGDVLTHCFNGKENGILDNHSQTIKEVAWEAYRKGVVFDIGHGTDSFNFHVAEIAFQEGMKATSISTDIYIRNRKNGPVYDLATTMEKLQTIGYSWQEIIEKITVIPAKTFRLKNKGLVEVGYDADFTIFSFVNAEKKLVDSNGETRITKQQIKPIQTIIGGTVYDNEL